jgi:hypothetical protein
MLAGRLIGVVGMVTLIAGCGTDPSRRDAVHYLFGLVASGADTTAERARYYDCFVTGSFQVPIPLTVSGTVHFPVTVTRRLSEQRGTHSELTTADSTIADAMLEYDGLGSDSLTFTLGAGPYVVALGPGAGVPTSQGEYAGPWTCDVTVPLAGDSTLGAYGYDPTLEIQGTWRISEDRPIG